MPKINSISNFQQGYPRRLAEIPDPPKQLFFRGELPDDTHKFVAIIGTRKPTRYGVEVTQNLARKLAERGVVIVSGLALGVDAIAHRGALVGNGLTIAVFAHGVDQISPRTNEQLGLEIEKTGALLSEYEPGIPVQHRAVFLERNRIVSGLSDAVIVTEASLRSGTSNTVASALQQGRDVYAVPGPITSPMSQGCNYLIAQGATPIVDIDAFVDQFIPNRASNTQPTLAYSNEEEAILNLIKQGLRDGDEIHAKSQLDAGLFAETLTMLELRGAIRPLGANQWSL